jgi:hypothetical protein
MNSTELSRILAMPNKSSREYEIAGFLLRNPKISFADSQHIVSLVTNREARETALCYSLDNVNATFADRMSILQRMRFDDTKDSAYESIAISNDTPLEIAEQCADRILDVNTREYTYVALLGAQGISEIKANEIANKILNRNLRKDCLLRIAQKARDAVKTENDKSVSTSMQKDQKVSESS